VQENITKNLLAQFQFEILNFEVCYVSLSEKFGRIVIFLQGLKKRRNRADLYKINILQYLQTLFFSVHKGLKFCLLVLQICPYKLILAL
jgi:hypothetical protein